MPLSDEELPDDVTGNPDDNIVDEAAKDETVAPVRYAITSYGSDPDVETMVKRLRDEKIVIPRFQRDYVWSMKEASRFIESLLLGLPVPGVFLAKDGAENNQVVIDGQQRLKTLQFFFDGVFNPKKDEKKQRVFRLEGVQEGFSGKTYNELSDTDRETLNNSILHATIIKQDTPEDDDTSIYHVFERLNSGGQKLTPQEVRSAVYHGTCIKLLKSLSESEIWKNVYGSPSKRLKDQELILRFFALLKDAENYTRPMSEFLSQFSKKFRNINSQDEAAWTALFEKSLYILHSAIGKTLFRPERSINAAVFDAVMVGTATRINQGPITDLDGLKRAYDQLLQDEDFVGAYTRATADEKSIDTRLKKAIAAFANLK